MSFVAANERVPRSFSQCLLDAGIRGTIISTPQHEAPYNFRISLHGLQVRTDPSWNLLLITAALFKRASPGYRPARESGSESSSTPHKAPKCMPTEEAMPSGLTIDFIIPNGN